jgi:O-antigen/teichoic acid export membrane protein
VSDAADGVASAPPAPLGRYRRQLLRNTAATGLANGWAIVVALVSVPLLVRGLGATAFGTWALLQTFSAITGWLSLADLGVGIAVTRAVADRAAVDDHAGVGRAVGSALAIAAAIGLGCAAVLAVAGRALMAGAFRVPDHLRDDLRLALLPFAVQVLFELVGSVAGSCLDGLQRIDRSRALDAGRRTVVIGAAVATALATERLAPTVAAAAAATVVATVVALVALGRELGAGRRARPHRATAGQLLHYGRRVWLLNGTGVLHRTMDRTIVGAVLGPAAVALVEVATQVQNGVAAVLSASSYAATSSAAWVQARDDRDRLRELLVRGTKYTCLATLPLCGLVAVLGGPLLDAWLPDRYGEAAGLIALAVAYLAIQAPLATGSNLLLGVGRAGAILRPAALAVVVNLAASIALVHAYGIAGAFVATIVSSLVLTPLLARAVADATGVGIGTVVRASVVPALPPAVAATAAAGAVAVAGLGPLVTLVAGFAVGTVAWVGAGLAFTFGPDERAELRRLLPGR